MFVAHIRITHFFFNDTATTEIYTLSLHDALPISARVPGDGGGRRFLLAARRAAPRLPHAERGDRPAGRLGDRADRVLRHLQPARGLRRGRGLDLLRVDGRRAVRVPAPGPPPPAPPPRCGEGECT